MSDYGDEDYSDYGEDWFYVEDEYMVADDLAEHAVASPPPTNTVGEDLLPEWDRFDYWNDLEYASDGYDEVTLEIHNVKGAQVGQKRKRTTRKTPARKRRSTDKTSDDADSVKLQYSPIVWRSRANRDTEPTLLDENETPYALLKNWREKLADTPHWARGPPPTSSGAHSSRPGKEKAVHGSDPASPPSDLNRPDDEELEEDMEDEDIEGDEEQGISQDALMAALQRQLEAAGGPLSGMDPQQLLEFAMRMAAGKDDGDEIAGDMTKAMLEGEDEEDDADAEENLLSWVAKQRNANKHDANDSSESLGVSEESKRPPTPPLSDTKKSVNVTETTSKSLPQTSALKRKADVDAESTDGVQKVVKKRITRSFDAPTAASQAKTVPARATRATRGKKS